MLISQKILSTVSSEISHGNRTHLHISCRRLEIAISQMPLSRLIRAWIPLRVSKLLGIPGSTEVNRVSEEMMKSWDEAVFLEFGFLNSFSRQSLLVSYVPKVSRFINFLKFGETRRRLTWVWMTCIRRFRTSIETSATWEFPSQMW